MRYTGKQIVSRIKGHVRKRGGAFAGWFIGVSAEPRSMLFERHSVRKQGDCWILMHATSSVVALKVETFLARKLGMTVGAGPREKAGDFVYAYKKTAHTTPSDQAAQGGHGQA